MSFKTPCDIRLLAGGSQHARPLLNDVVFSVNDALCDKYGLSRGFDIHVPAGYVTDLATVPRILWSIFPRDGEYAPASIVHDYLYSSALISKSFADDIFNEASRECGTPTWRRLMMFTAVRIFGKGKY